MKNRSLPAALSLLLSLPLFGSCASIQTMPHQVTPQRPTLSSDTATVPEGTLEFESGLTYDPGDSADTPSSLKYGLGPRTEGFLSWSPLLYVDQPGEDGFGIGDLVIGMRHRFVDGAQGRPSFALQTHTKLPTADEREGLGNGEIDWHVAVMTTFAYGPYVVTNFYELGVLGEINGEDTDLRHVLAASVAGPPRGRWGNFGEIAGIYTPERDISAGLLTGGLTWSDRPEQVFDAGLVLGFGDDGPDLQLVVGFTRSLGTASDLARGLRLRR